MTDDPGELAEKFNIHFLLITNKRKEKLLELNFDLSRSTTFVNSRKDWDTVFTLKDITVTQVSSILKRVSSNKSAGMEKINASSLCLALPVIALSITHSQLEIFPSVEKLLYLSLCLKMVMVMLVTLPVIIQFLS